MKSYLSKRALFAALAVLAANTANADVFTAWNFDNLSAAVNNTPLASTGVGSASALGMTNNYTYTGGKTVVTGSVNTDDVLADATTGDTTQMWRVRGQTPGNGWNNAAPQYSQGAQFTTSTVGYSNIDLKFDWFSTAQGIRDMQVQYTTDGSTWSNVGSLLVNTTPNTAFTTQEINFGVLGITSVENNANFGVRLVSAYDPTLSAAAGQNEYAAATLSSGQPVQYNNNSGNWRFDNVIFSGTSISAVPEPETYGMMLSGIGLMGFVARRRKSA